MKRWELPYWTREKTDIKDVDVSFYFLAVEKLDIERKLKILQKLDTGK